MADFFELLRQHWFWISGVVSLGGALGVLLLSTRFAQSDAVDQIAGRVGALERRADLTDERMRHMPTGEDMKALQAALAVQNASIEKLNAKSEAQAGTLLAISEQLAMLTRHLLDRGGEK
ncbi:DUF2730 domain-containing protein [Inquilinus limosus]|uniref:DUF2730 family protein n=1 Tax=Inquilinus limosus TaxID=171674 RepID=UPI0003FD764B|nr:DUF2730 family protein [Inquilinus limosus]